MSVLKTLGAVFFICFVLFITCSIAISFLTHEKSDIYELNCNDVEKYIKDKQPIQKYNYTEYFWLKKIFFQHNYTEQEILNKVLYCEYIGE